MKKKSYELLLSEYDVIMLRKAIVLWQRTIEMYEQHPDMELTIKTKPKKWWQWGKR